MLIAEPKLLPCRKCGNDRDLTEWLAKLSATIGRTIDIWGNPDDLIRGWNGSWAIQCLNMRCSHKGPSVKIESKEDYYNAGVRAMQLWNKEIASAN